MCIRDRHNPLRAEGSLLCLVWSHLTHYLQVDLESIFCGRKRSSETPLRISTSQQLRESSGSADGEINLQILRQGQANRFRFQVAAGLNTPNGQRMSFLSKDILHAGCFFPKQSDHDRGSYGES